MINSKKILKIFFLVVFLFELFGFGLILTIGKTALAADPINLNLQVPIPGGPSNIDFTNNKSTKPIADYIRVIYKYAIGIVGILATVVMMIGGIMWIMSGGSPERAGEAKAYISASLTGLVLTLASYLILATVNPALVNFKITDVASVSELGCCYSWPVTSEADVKCEAVSESVCVAAGKKYINSSCADVGYCSAKMTCALDENNGQLCVTAESKQGYCVNGSSACNPCKLSGATCSFGRDYECCSDVCDVGLASAPPGTPLTTATCKYTGGTSGKW